MNRRRFTQQLAAAVGAISLGRTTRGEGTSLATSLAPGSLAGNHFLTITSGLEHLREMGRLVLWQGAQQLRIDAA